MDWEVIIKSLLQLGFPDISPIWFQYEWVEVRSKAWFYNSFDTELQFIILCAPIGSTKQNEIFYETEPARNQTQHFHSITHLCSVLVRGGYKEDGIQYWRDPCSHAGGPRPL